MIRFIDVYEHYNYVEAVELRSCYKMTLRKPYALSVLLYHKLSITVVYC